MHVLYFLIFFLRKTFPPHFNCHFTGVLCSDHIIFLYVEAWSEPKGDSYIKIFTENQVPVESNQIHRLVYWFSKEMLVSENWRVKFSYELSYTRFLWSQDNKKCQSSINLLNNKKIEHEKSSRLYLHSLINLYWASLNFLCKWKNIFDG